MAIHSLSPAYVEIDYHSARGPHTMTRPTRAWEGTPWASAGTYTNWEDDEVDADEMIEGFITLLLPLFKADTAFDRYTIYTQATPTSDPEPVYSKILDPEDFTGSAASTLQSLTYEKVFTFITVGGWAAKCNLLDVPTGGVISKAYAVTGAELAVVNALLATEFAWSGRDDSRIAAFRSLSNGVNDALKRRYRL